MLFKTTNIQENNMNKQYYVDVINGSKKDSMFVSYNKKTKEWMAFEYCSKTKSVNHSVSYAQTYMKSSFEEVRNNAAECMIKLQVLRKKYPYKTQMELEYILAYGEE